MKNPVLDIIHQRRSIGNLVLPMPNQDELDAVLHAAMVAPDHKQLKPWKFWVLTGDALVEFGKVLLQAAEADAAAQGVTLDDATIKKTLNIPLRAPMIIVIATDMKSHEKVPPFEQLLSAGAAAQNILLALESLGYKSVWRTGLLCNTDAVKAYFGVGADDTICGLIYTGSSSVQMPARDAHDLSQFVQYRDSHHYDA
ncbi:nitroreductase [uncultured Moraxella sp.]|uniref:nitroreductase family protein n=1 Tax=uncultured Moraxella sp. TaxID=263769 RepID=UPI0025EE5E24|nr:nitroreductase [uncultured Moraxella sp.]